MVEYSAQNKKAWEYNAYEFWVKQAGTPADRAKKDLENPIGMLKKYSDYFDTYNNLRVANICGSCGNIHQHHLACGSQRIKASIAYTPKNRKL